MIKAPFFREIIIYFLYFPVYDVLTGEIVKTLNNQNACVRDISWHPFLSEIVSSSWDCTVMRWKYEDLPGEGDCVELEKNSKKSLLPKKKKMQTVD